MRFYVNAATGFVTRTRSVAMGWYRDGNSIEVWRRGRCILRMNAIL